MVERKIQPSIQDFSMIDTTVNKIMVDLKLKTKSSAFYFYVLDLLLHLQEDEIKESITDTNYLMEMSECKGHDRGIDAVFIEDTESKTKIHLFNFKYAETFEKTKSHFPAGEIDKILGFITALMSQDNEYTKNINPILLEKMQSIWGIFKTENPEFVMHICSNKYYTFEKQEKERFERGVKRNRNFEIEYHLMSDIVTLLTKKGKTIVNAKIKAIDEQYFDRTDGDVKALIVNIDVVDLLRICIDDENIRNTAQVTDYAILREHVVLEDAFEDNVRIYLKQRSKINRNIKYTALSDESHRFFYYNNGITITCEHFEYPGGSRRSPIIELKNLQIVNGGQTIHALFEAFKENQTKFDKMTILCRIYETRNKSLSINIAEYTNSQNPVSTRDIRSIDYIQIKLEKEFEALGYFYERKKNQYSNKPAPQRIDLEKVGQVLMAFYHDMPSEAKDKKRLIFADKYDEIFDESINADKILLPTLLFQNIEEEKTKMRNNIFVIKGETDIELYKRDGLFLYSSYWILNILCRMALYKKIELKSVNSKTISEYYPIACRIIKEVWDKRGDEEITYESFFKKNKPMKYVEEVFDSEKIKNYFPENQSEKKPK